MSVRLASLLLASATVAACAPQDRAVHRAGRVGASIAVSSDGSRVIVVNPDQGSISILDSTSLESVATIDVGGEPHALLLTPSDEILVATYRGGEIVRVSSSGAAVIDRRSVCAGPYGLAATLEGDTLVACEWDGVVVRLKAGTLDETARYAGFLRPRAVAGMDDGVVVADYVGGTIHTVKNDGSTSTSSLVPAQAPYRPALTTMSANLASALVPAFGSLYVTHVLENHTGDQTLEKVADDYGSVLDTNPKINPALTTLGSGAPVTYAKFDGGARVFNGPVAGAPIDDRRLLVVHVSTANVAVIDTSEDGAESRVVGSFTVGSGPHGVAVDEARHVAFVDNAFDRSVSRLDLSQSWSQSAPRYPAALTRIRPLAERYSAAALAGRKLFYDATNTHVTPSAVVICASCHPGGGDDGLVWFVHTPNIPLKRRRTPHLANAHTETAPFHWNGEHKNMGDLVRETMTDLMAGDGLLVEVEGVQAYIDEMVEAPVLGATDPTAAQRGKTLFDGKAACATCHVGESGTDGELYSLLAPMSLAPDDLVSRTNTPALHGLFLRAPYLHDGRSPDLRDLLTRPDAVAHGQTSDLSASEIDDLVSYLRTL